MNNIPIEVLMYQLGGSLPSIVRDSVTPRELAMMDSDVKYSPVEGLKQLDTTNLDNFNKNELLLSENARKARIDEERIRVADKTADRQVKADSAKNLQYLFKTMKDETDLLSGIPTFLPSAKPMIDNINKESQGLSSALADAQMSMFKGTDVSPEVFARIQKSRDAISKLTSSEEYYKLMSVKPVLEGVLKDYNNHASGENGKIVDEVALKKYYDKLNTYILSSNGVEPPGKPDDPIVINTRDFEKMLKEGIKAFAKGNTQEMAKFEEDYPKGGRMLKTYAITDLTDAPSFVDKYTEAVKAMGGGEAYIRSIGGEGNFRTYVNNLATIANPSWGKESQIATDEKFIANPAAPRSRGGSTGSDGVKRTPAEQAKVDQFQKYLAQYGMVAQNPGFMLSTDQTGIYQKISSGAPLNSSEIAAILSQASIVDISTGEEIDVPTFVDKRDPIVNQRKGNTTKADPASTAQKLKEASAKRKAEKK